MKNRLIVDIYWCALSATWCCKTFTIIHAQNSRSKNFCPSWGGWGGCGRIPLDPPLTTLLIHSDFSIRWSLSPRWPRIWDQIPPFPFNKCSFSLIIYLYGRVFSTATCCDLNKKTWCLTFLIVKIFFDMFVLTATQLHNSQVAQTKKYKYVPYLLSSSLAYTEEVINKISNIIDETKWTVVSMMGVSSFANVFIGQEWSNSFCVS